MSPRFTLALFAQDAELQVDRAVRSVLSDPRDDLEFIAIDAGSTDDTTLQLHEWARTDPRMKVLRLARCAEAEAFNAAISLARGRHLGFLDAHDWLSPEAFNRLRAARDADLLIGRYDSGRGPLSGAHLVAPRAELISTRRRAWAVWFRTDLLRNSGARLGAQQVDLDLHLMLDALEAAQTMTGIEAALLHRGQPSARWVAPPLLEVVSERLSNLRRLLRGNLKAHHRQAARDEGLELVRALAGLPSESRRGRMAELRGLMRQAVGLRWPALEARVRVRQRLSRLVGRSRAFFSKNGG